MKFAIRTGCGLLVAGLLAAGCVTTGGDMTEKLDTVSSPAWSLDDTQRNMTVAVSPVRQTFQIAGSYGRIVGTGIAAIIDSRHRNAVLEVLEGYDAGSVFEAHLSERINEAFEGNIARVSTLGSTAGYSQRSDAEAARFEGLHRRGHDLLIDIDVTYGIFGYAGTLITKINANMHALPRGNRVWRGEYLVSSQPILAGDRLADPTNLLRTSYTNPRLRLDENAISQWTGDGGAVLRSRFEQSVEGAVSALLTDLGLVDEAIGRYFLGFHYMNRRDYEDAAEHFRRALELEPAMVDARNGLAVNLAHDDQVDEAIELAEEIVAEHPDYGPAHLNLAWWYALEKKDADKATYHYDTALGLGMYPERRIDRFLDR